jgi:inosine/xanthosine triphosphate pyrophosphatase family protein
MYLHLYSYGEMTAEEKNEVSHRKKALTNFKEYIVSHFINNKQ